MKENQQELRKKRDSMVGRAAMIVILVAVLAALAIVILVAT